MKYLIAIPCMDMMHTNFVRSLVSMRLAGNCEIALAISSLIYDARNHLAEKAVKGGFDRVLWLDSDMTFDRDIMERLAARLDEGRDFVSALYIKRKEPIAPCIYSAGDMDKPVNDTFDDYPQDAIFEIAACGFGGVMMTTELLQAVGSRFGFPFSPLPLAGEDLSFCYRARALKRKLYCDSSIKMGHIGTTEITEETFQRERSVKSGDF